MRYLIVDIATTAQADIEDSHYLSWANKRGSMTPEQAFSRAGLHPEFGMICGLAANWVNFGTDDYTIDRAFSMTAKSSEDEKHLLAEFEKLLDSDVILCGHNVCDFAVPYLTKRYLASGFVVPAALLDAINDGAMVDTMRALACGGVSVMSLRASAWMLGVDDPRANVASPQIYDLHKDGRMGEIARLTEENCMVSARVFGVCALGKLIVI